MHATHDVLIYIYIYTISIIGFTFIIRSSGIPVYSSQVRYSSVYSDSTDIALFAHSGILAFQHSSILVGHKKDMYRYIYVY